MASEAKKVDGTPNRLSKEGSEKATLQDPGSFKSKRASGRISGEFLPIVQQPALTPDKRPNAKEYTKWEKPLPFNLEDFMNQYVDWKDNNIQHAEWKQTVVLRYERELHDFIRTHWKESSKTRLRFGSMNPEHIWDNEAEMTMKLTKRNMATLDPAFVLKLDAHILSVFTEYMEAIRTEGRAIAIACYASTEEKGEIDHCFEGSAPEDYCFENYGRHLALQTKLRTELKAKFHVIEYLRQRELYCDHLVDWEKNHSRVTQLNAKGKSDWMNWIGKFRIEASKYLVAANAKAGELIAEYEKAQGHEFMLNGQKYVKNYLDRQKAQVARVQTNFSQLTTDVLFFRLEGDGSAIAHRVLDPVLEGLVREGPQLTAPPPMPIYAAEVEFLFTYY